MTPRTLHIHRFPQRPFDRQTLSIDESPELSDPYSDLTLFLSQKIKDELQKTGRDQKWSSHLQEKLVEKISPEFKSRFPYYRLGVAALKKIWEKVAYLTAMFEHNREALTKDGKLDLTFLIRENLKTVLGQKILSFHPYLLAQQLALKIAESFATYNAVRPVLRHITTLIWSLERHLLPPQSILKVPSMKIEEELDEVDQLILKFMLQALGKDPYLSQEALQSKIRQIIHCIQKLPLDLTQQITHILQTLSSPPISEPFHLQMFRDEISYILVDRPTESISDSALAAVGFFAKAKNCLASLPPVEIEHKMSLWTMQGELVLRLVQIEETLLLQLLQDHPDLSLRKILQTQLRHYPILKPFVTHIAARARILSRYRWYALSSTPLQSTVNRFFQWHLKRLSGPHKIVQLADICQKQLPMLPFDPKTAEEIEKKLIRTAG